MRIETIDKESSLENLIYRAQEGFGHIHRHELWLESNDTAKAFGEAARDKLLAYKLVEYNEGEKVLRLTERGWQSESFTEENAKIKLANKKLKIDIANAERINATYWWTFGIAVAAFLISLVLLILKLKV